MELSFNQLQVICISYIIIPFNVDVLMLRAKYNSQFILQGANFLAFYKPCSTLCIFYQRIADVLKLLLDMFISGTGLAAH